jgi:3'-5' exoribonuclease
MKIEALRTGEGVKGKFAVTEKLQIKEYRLKKGKYFFLRVGDDTGESSLKYWGNGDSDVVEKLFSDIEEGSVLDVDGVCIIDEYTGHKAINVDAEAGHSVRLVDPSEYDCGEFVPKTQIPYQVLMKRLRSLLGCVKDSRVKAVLDEFFEDDEFLKKFMEAPAAVRQHHGYLGGLLEHSVNIGELCRAIHEHHPELDLDLLLAGALLRNIGKVREFEVQASIQRSDMGNMLSHAVMSDEMLMEAAQRVHGMPEELMLRLRHMVLSSGKKDWGTLVPPRIPEAMALYLAEQLDATLNTFIRIRMEASGSEDRWSYARELGYNILARDSDER